MGELILLIAVIVGIYLLGDVVGGVVSSIVDRTANAAADAAAKGGAPDVAREAGGVVTRGMREEREEASDD